MTRRSDGRAEPGSLKWRAAQLLGAGRPESIVAGAIGVPPSVVARWLRDDPAFAAHVRKLQRPWPPKGWAEREQRKKQEREAKAEARRRRLQALLSVRPRCGARCKDGHKCQTPVLWDARLNRPISDRCWRHGGVRTWASSGRPWGPKRGRRPQSREENRRFAARRRREKAKRQRR